MGDTPEVATNVSIPVEQAKQYLETLDALASSHPIADVPLAELRRTLRHQLYPEPQAQDPVPETEGGEQS